MKVYFIVITIAVFILFHSGVSAACAAETSGAGKDRYINVLKFGTDTDIAAAFSSAGGSLGEEVNRKVLDALGERHSEKACLALVRYVGNAAMAEAEPLLIRELGRRTQNDDYKEAVVVSIGQLRQPGSLDPLSLVYGEAQTSIRIRKAILDAYGKIGDPGLEEWIIEIARNENENAELRAHAVLALGEFGGKKAFETLKTLVLNTYDAKLVRMYAVTALKEIGKGDALEILGALIDDPVHEVAEYAVNGIADIGTDRGGELLVRALRSDYDKVRYYAIQGLSRMDYPAAADILKFKSEHDANETVRREARKALASMKESAAVAQ